MTAPPPAFHLSSREENIRRLFGASFDVLVIGGGINGAGIARDLAQRARHAGHPLSIALVEQRHFASGTSGRNSQLIHGGLRYLKQMQFGLVREALRERAALLDIAPHLVEPLPLLIPMFGAWSRFYYGCGLWLYDILAGKRNVGRRRYFTPRQLRALEPELAAAGLTAAAAYYDCKVHSARLVLENIFDAARDGAVIANYLRAESWRREQDAYRVELADSLSGERGVLTARRIVDARGPWEGGKSLRLVRGSHLVLPRLLSSGNALAHFHTDGRIIFFIPWGPDNSLTLVGTTDIDHNGPPDEVSVSRQEVDYLMAIVRALFPAAAGMEPLSAYSSLRPLLKSVAGSPTSASREHKIWLDPEGLLHIAGGKYTTYRSMSEEAVDLLFPGWKGQCRTALTPLGGNSGEQVRNLLGRVDELAAGRRLDPAAVRVLARDYGLQADLVINSVGDEEAEPGRLQAAVIDHAVRHEMARRLPDVLFVSTYWGYERPLHPDWVMPVARRMGAVLGWDAARIAGEAALAARIAALPEPHAAPAV